MQKQFWKRKKLEELSEEEWESICSRCGKCCLVKVQFDDDEYPDKIYYTNVVCKYFNHDNCSCKEYEKRCILVPECLKLDIGNIDKIEWMPQSCSYRTLLESGDLPKWHPLLTTKPLDDKYTIKGKCVCQTKVNEDDLEDYIIEDEEI